MEERIYKIRGRKEDLEALENALKHIEYLGIIGASRNIMIRVDGDGSGRVTIYKDNERLNVNKDKYSIDQDKLKHGCVGVYDIG